VEVLGAMGGQGLALSRRALGCITSSRADEARWVQGTGRDIVVAQVPDIIKCCLVGPHGDPSAGWALGRAPGSREAVSSV